MLSALKRSEDNKGLILRLYETDGAKTDVCISGDVLPAPLSACFNPWEMKTFFLEDGKPQWKEVLLTEFDM